MLIIFLYKIWAFLRTQYLIFNFIFLYICMIWVSLILCWTLMFFYVIWRFFVIFGNDLKFIPIIIAIILSVIVFSTFMYQWNSKILDIIWTISSWIFVLWFLLLIILAIFHAISYVRHPINPWIILWVIILILWTWVYCSLRSKITNLNIETNKIQKDAKILLVSDIHVENVTQNLHVNQILKAIELEKPDFVIIAWDLMNKPNITYLKYFSSFKSVKDTPIFAVIWNHDVMWNTGIVNKIPEVSGIKILNNESIEINWVRLIWLVDKSLRWVQSPKKFMDSIKNENNSDLFSILITHQPISLEKIEDYPFDLEVAWHTHRGQFYWIMELSRLANDYLYWEYKYGDKIVFVTQWIWTWWLPFRLWTQSEMVIINLIKK